MRSHLSLILCVVAYASGSLSAVAYASDSLEAAPKATLTLRMCRELALANQPAIAAAQATLAAAIDRANALDRLRGLASLSRDLPVRRKQAARGVVIAQAALAQTEAETLYGVTFCYLSAVYANQQMKLAKEIHQNLEVLQKLVDDSLQAAPGKKAVSHPRVVLKEHRNVVNAYLATLQGRLQEAQQGEQRALAALREAMGVDYNYPLAPLPDALPCPKVELNKEELIALALARRGEIVQTANAVDVICLEVAAQGRTRRQLARTFAAGSDIHSRPTPTGVYESRNYRPGALALEMPTTLVGSRGDRQTQARDYLQRAQAVDAKTRQLITLTVEDAYLRWREKSEQAEKLQQAYQEHWQLSNKLREEIKYPIDMEKQRQPVPPYPNMDDLLHANVVTTRLVLEWQEAHYQALLALAALEHATGGGFAVDFDAAPTCPPVTPPIRAQ
jgi:outer membrane protein TolC